jgi:hypothetical protein
MARRRTALKRRRQIFGWLALGWLKFLAEEAAYGKTVWSWHPLLVSSWRRNVDPTGFRQSFNPSAMEAKGIRLQGELGISRQTIAQGMPECSSCTCMLVCALPRAHCTRDRGCSKHPAFPAPSVLRDNVHANLGRRAPRECKTVSTSLRGANATKQSMSPQAALWIASLRSQ